MKRILLIEDDRTLNQGLGRALANDEICVESCFSLAEAREVLHAHVYSLVILDVNLPDGSGMDFLGELKQDVDVPVILLTANDMEVDIVTGLELGADDYITKPFSLAVLRARVNTQLRKSRDKGVASDGREEHKGNSFETEEFYFDFDRMEFFRNGESVELSKTELKLLRYLIENKGHTLTREMLLDYVWTDGLRYVDENALSVSIKRLRDKLEETPSKPRYIKTVYGVGYTWVVE